MKPQAILAMVLALGLGGGAVAAPTPASPPAAAAQAPIELNGFPNRDGPLTAMLLIIPEAELAEFDKPFDQAPRLSLLHSARVGETVALKILFTSPQRDADGMIDLTYDVKIIGPDGMPYGDEYTGLEAIRHQVRPDGAVFDNVRAILKLSFEPGDARGVYRFVVVLHDNNGDRHIPMTIDLEFKD